MFELVDGRAGRRDHCLGRQFRLQGVIELLLADRLVVDERREPGHVELGFAQLGLRLRHLALGLRDRGLESPRVDFEKRSARPHGGTLQIVLFDQVSAYLRPNLGVHRSIEGPDPFAGDGHVLLLHGRHLHVHGRRRLDVVFCTSPRGAQYKYPGQRGQRPPSPIEWIHRQPIRP